jgi:hypothetical protein
MTINLKSTVITAMDATPWGPGYPTAGEGIKGAKQGVDDNVAVTNALAQYDVYRLCRFPTAAKVKHVRAYGKGIDSNATNAATFDVNVAFSDSTQDWTQPALQGTIPTTALDGTVATVTAGTGYTGTPNKLFGSAVALNANSGAALSQDLVFAGGWASAPQNTLIPLWNYFGFVDQRGNAVDPGGNFDLLLMCQHAGTTAASGVIQIEVDFVL